MGLLDLFNSKPATALARLPAGSFTLDREGRVIVSTVSSAFPAEMVQEIGACVLDTFREGREAGLPLSELVIYFGGFKIVAREMRGGAIVFLSPRNTITPSKQP